MSTYFRAVSRSGRGCPRLRCGEGSSCPPGTSPVFSTDEAGCPICTCRKLTAFLRPSTSCPPLDCSHLVCVGPVHFSSRLVGHCPVCECVAVNDDDAAESTGTATSSSCPELDCFGHFRCQGGRKIDPLTGCETCECVDVDCADCEAVCASSEPTHCAAVCGCDDVNRYPCRPLPIDCELRVGCVLGVDADGCEVCRCAVDEMLSNTPNPTSVCPQITCPLTCDDTGYTVDENGCRVCACADEEAETTTTTTTTTAITSTSCAEVDCVSQCPKEFNVVEGDDGCDVCVCTKAETVADSEDDVTTLPLNGCSGGTDCKSAGETDRPNDGGEKVTAARCEPVTRDNCDVNCVVATDDVGCQFCLCDDPPPETEMTNDQTTTAVAKDLDDATPKNVDDACEHQFICHPICQTIKDRRGCVVECRCDDVISSVEHMQQQEPEVVAESESRVMCSTADGLCSCDVDEEELWRVDVDGCPTCACITPSATTDDVAQSRVEYTTSMTTTTAHPRTLTIADTTTQATTSTTTVTTTTTMTSTSHPEVTSATSTVTTSSPVNLECRPLSENDCAGVTCGDDGYAKDVYGCDTCSCAVAVEEKQPAKTVYHVVAAARKGIITQSRMSYDTIQ